HERIDPRTIVEAVRKRNGAKPQMSLFAAPEENPPIRQAIEFYKHRHNWTNRLIAGDSLLVMNSLLEKEGLGGQVQMVYIDPPYGIRYGSNFQPFVNKREVTDGKDEDLTQEPETIRAFRDTWELGIHSYLAYLRDRLLLARELLHESGSVFVQIGDENVHRAGMVMDEIFGAENRVATISYATTGASSTSTLPEIADYLLWYAKDRKLAKYRQLYEPLTRAEIIDYFNWDAMVELPDGQRRKPTPEERFDPDRYLPKDARIYQRMPLSSRGLSTTGRSDPYEWNNRVFCSPVGQQWRVSKEGMDRLAELGRLEALEGQTSLRWKKYEDEVPGRQIHNIWAASMSPDDKRYVVQTSTKAIQRCMLMTTDPGDLVFDPTCGSGTTAHIAEQWGRRWITCDTSRVATALAKQRLLTASFDYYELAHQDEGVGAGFRYRSVATVSARTLGYDEPPNETMLYDQPRVDKTKTRVTGPFTVEAVPAPAVKPLDEIVDEQPADQSVARTGQTLRQADWRDELFRTGIRGKAGQRISFARLEPLPGTRWLHAEGETRPDSAGADRVCDGGTAENPERVVISFGPDHAPIEQRQIALAIEEAQTLVPKPTIIIFAAFQFDPEASKDIDETNWPGVTLLKAQMNADLLTDDLKKKRTSNESFWLIGQPDVELEQVSDGEDKNKLLVSVRGFDYYNTKTGNVESGGKDRIAMWMLDTDYDGRSLFPRQVFFPMAGDEDGWAKLAKNLKAEIDTDLIEAYRGTTSLPFEASKNKRIAVKIIDDRGIESLKIIEIE
ncbi:MAG: site-specific DNA-methyltransferase, partial [Nitrospira sp.]|nr:site-specific DNA-methyltransferase [Nitrospira sp.]